MPHTHAQPGALNPRVAAPEHMSMARAAFVPMVHVAHHADQATKHVDVCLQRKQNSTAPSLSIFPAALAGPKLSLNTSGHPRPKCCAKMPSLKVLEHRRRRAY
eukprot:3989065-Alexandrium_andersonii.AAC.1